MASTIARKRRPLLFLVVAGFVVGVVWLTRAAWRPSRIGGGPALPAPVPPQVPAPAALSPFGARSVAVEPAAAQVAEPVVAPAAVAQPVVAPPGPVTATSADDLTRIEGIGPKIAAALVSEGVATFDALAAADPEQLRLALAGHGLRFAPSLPTWPTQARQFSDPGSAPR